MKRTVGWLLAIACCAMCSVHAEFTVEFTGAWPKTWPQELDALRKQSLTLEGPLVLYRIYEIPCVDRTQFESAWPQLLKVKGKGAPIFLLRGPNKWLGAPIPAGVRIHTPPLGEPDRGENKDRDKSADPRDRWLNSTYIELIVDGKIVDLNRIPLPADTPVIDERFKPAPEAK